uniref:Dysbindin domain containing 2 n=1 Tax=Felis catus TaxID=9685 RepID=A0ABI8A6K9_FELCA
MSQFQHTTVLSERNKCGKKSKRGRGQWESKGRMFAILKWMEREAFTDQKRCEQGPEGGADMDPNPRAALERQQLRLRERQKFFEDILQPETEFVFPLSHLHLESQRPPIGSISSMEVNVDALEQVELIDLGDQDGADVFLPCEDPPPTPQTSGMDDRPEELGLPTATPDRTASRTSSSSSDDSTNLHSPNPSDGGADTPLAQSDEEEDGADGGAEPGACS